MLKKEGIICNNACTTAAVYLRAGAQFKIHGKISDNTSTGNCAALYIVTNGDSSHATLEQGGEICNNTNSGSKYGAAVELQAGQLLFHHERRHDQRKQRSMRRGTSAQRQRQVHNERRRGDGQYLHNRR